MVIIAAGYFASSRLTRTAAAGNRLGTYRLVTMTTVVTRDRATTAIVPVSDVAQHAKPVTMRVVETRLVPTLSIRTVTTTKTVKAEPVVVMNSRTVTKERTVIVTTTVAKLPPKAPPPPPAQTVTVVQTLPVTVSETVTVTTTVPPPKKHP
jgi:hypothetical protein